MSDAAVAADLRRRSTFLLVAAMLVDAGAIAILVIPAVRGADVMTALPMAIPLFVVASALFVVGITTRKKADAAEA